MSKQRDDRVLLADIPEAVQNIQLYVADMTYEEFSKDTKTVDAVARNLEIIGEASKLISNPTKELLSSVPWSKIKGLRNRIVHEYFNVSKEIIWFVTQNELVSLRSAIESFSN